CGFNSIDDEFPDEKRAILSHDPRTAEEIAEQVVHAIVNAEKGGKHLHKTLNNIVGATGWTEKVAEWTLAKLEQALKEASKLGPALKEAYDKAWEAARGIEGFVQEHPVFCTVIALGVLVMIAPWAIEALGFGELGPIEGSFAALWQARYAGYVPKGSLFSFFQRLGMT
ncbi:hypothetical protein K505DRAFT_189854, partial [Melanomma pulvis-pyrius CBS 109.77]